ncbi:conserved hypothetical protein [Desulfamplus magnetovallimortis]|uniref:DUF1009 domain-containing protein n=1 Tax=Desulfamplus magnetovallimortis TaxID=1246637 RepID=A0A1W1H4Q0_9BACT|nr:UDP-2,3-diacylglucosamine diphosphatase LpxI [Desulfamplus magnetovallimortis]SLM27460.1 conserved hypothetical protein [Desulfamplus magnetovallimortis]
MGSDSTNASDKTVVIDNGDASSEFFNVNSHDIYDSTVVTPEHENKRKRVGLIAGGGQFPLLFAERAVKKGYKVFVAAYVSEAESEIEKHASEVEWLHLGQVGRLIRFFRKHYVSEAVMVGSVQKTRIFKDIKPDFKAIKFIISRKNSHDDFILRSFADLLENEGIKIRPSTFLLPDLLSPRGCWTRRKPASSEYRDIETGWHVAREIGRLDVGQCVVIANGTVLAVEAADGTDATIERGASLANIREGASGWDKKSGFFSVSEGGVIVVKLAKPQQDLRFDMPASGIKTIETMIRCKASVLVLEAEKSISFDRKEMIEMADNNGISIVAMQDSDFTSIKSD